MLLCQDDGGALGLVDSGGVDRGGIKSGGDSGYQKGQTSTSIS